MDLNVLFPEVIMPSFVFVNPASFIVHGLEVIGFSDTSKTRAIDEFLGLWIGVPIKSRFLGLVTLKGIIYLSLTLVITITDFASMLS